MSENIMTFFRSNRGSITIEFSILFVLFLFILLSSAEMARLFYISSNLDLAVSEATKAAKTKARMIEQLTIQLYDKNSSLKQVFLGHL